MTRISEPQWAFSAYGTQQVAAQPFIKWAGGKSQLLPQMTRLLPEPHRFQRYFEPFLGGGAVFFYLQPAQAFLSDNNEELINAFVAVRDNVEALIISLKEHHNESRYYYGIRALNPLSLSCVERASRFIYMNRTCYNGLYRVNRRGQFNVPFGRYKNPRIVDEEGLRAASLALRQAHLSTSDFEVSLTHAGQGDFVYLDPPYQPLSVTASFTTYTSSGFEESDQRRLATLYHALDRRGVLLMLSNSDTPLIRELYRSFRITELQARRAINCRPEGRGPITELLILNY